MMKPASKIVILLLITALFAGCNKQMDEASELSESSGSSAKAQVAFNINADVYEIESGEALTRSALISDKITKLWYKVFTEDGTLVDLYTGSVSSDCSKLTLEGLKDGLYVISILATTDTDKVSVEEPSSSALDVWLQSNATNEPLNHDMLHQNVPFIIGQDAPNINQNVTLKRAVGLVKLNIKARNENSRRFIRKVDISFNNVTTQLLVNGKTRGSSKIDNFDITQSNSLYSLPTSSVSGRVTVSSVSEISNDIIAKSYSFTNAQIVANELLTININWEHPDDDSGVIHVRTSDYGESTHFGKMFQDGEAYDTLSSQPKRMFYVREPLEVSINHARKIRLRFFSAIGMKNVKIMCRFKNFSNEFVEVAQFDSIRAFQESMTDFPVVSKACTFRLANGDKITIPALTSLDNREENEYAVAVENNDVEFQVVTDDPYMAKINMIKPGYDKGLNWKVFIANKGTLREGMYREMQPMHCREVCALITNMAFMYSSDEFDKELRKNYSDKLKDDIGNIITPDMIHQQLTRKIFQCGRLVGANGTAEKFGLLYTLTHEVWKQHYWDWGTADTFLKTTAYHEMGHKMGYDDGTKSNMTYGEVWTVLCSRVMYDLGRAGKLPVSSRFVLNTGDKTID